MRQSARHTEPGEDQEYILDGTRYRKTYDPLLKRHTFLQDGHRISLAEWNRVVNRHQPMSNKLHHSLFVVRFLEKRRRKMLVDLVDPGRSSLGADVGCERGYLAAALAAAGARVLAVDLEGETIAEAAGNTPASLPVTYLCSDVTALSFRSGVLDFCLCAETLEHVDKIDDALAELARVTKPGGRLILAIPNERWIVFVKRVLCTLGLGKVLGKLSRGPAMGHLDIYSRKQFLALLPPNLHVLRAFYDKPFFLNLYVVAEVGAGAG